MSDRLSRPRVEPGMHLDSVVKEHTLVDCKVCGWGDEGPYEQMRQAFMAHTHDPIYDIRARVVLMKDHGWGNPPNGDYLRDVEYLLDQLEPRPDEVSPVPPERSEGQERELT